MKPSSPSLLSPWLSLAILALATCGFGEGKAEQIVLAEVHYHPKDQRAEYIECYNQTATPLDMADWRLTGGIEYAFPSFDAAQAEEAFARPWERFVIGAVSPEELRAQYNIPSSVRVFGPWEGRLADSGDHIELQDKNGVTLVGLDYRDDGQWPIAADGLGPSLVLVNGDGDVRAPASWSFSQQAGGTPGFEPLVGGQNAIDSPELDLSKGLLLVDFGDDWAYHDGNQDLGNGWQALGFDDAGWDVGSGLLGFENATLPEPGIQTPLNDANQLTYYFRKEFSFQGDRDLAALNLDAIVDDGAVFYLNGTEIARLGVGSGTVGFDTTSSRTVTDAALEEKVASPSGSLLKVGTNVLAAEAHQTSATSSDLVFGARLSLQVEASPSVVINEVLPASDSRGFIEFYNPHGQSIELTHHYLSDDGNRLNKYPINQEVIVPARGKAIVAFSSIGMEPSADLTLFLTEPDGGTPVAAIAATVAQDGRSIGRMPDGGSQWFAFSQPTPLSANGSDPSQSRVHLNEVHYAEQGQIDWVEWINQGEEAVDLTSMRLIVGDNLEEAIPLSGVIAPGQRLQSLVDLAVGNGAHRLSLATESLNILSSHRFDSPGLGWTWQAWPEGSREFLAAESPTPGAANQPVVETGIVIHEIMFDPPSNLGSGEFIELFNRSGNTVDLTGWRLTHAVDFVFPATTLLAPGGYLVIAADAERLMQQHGMDGVLGNYQGQLGNNGERLRLEDAWGNLVDEVDYKVGGEWPAWPNGGGSSLELVHPLNNNALGTAWQASDESAKGSWQAFTYRDRFTQSRTFGSESDYKEIYFHLANDGHVILRNIQLIRLSDGVNLIENPERMSGNNRSAAGWLGQGNHWETHVDDNGWLHILSDGRGDNRPNRVEIDVPQINRNDLCEIRFEARWVSGSPRLIFSTWDHSIANNFLVPIPENLGSPGKANSTAQPQALPQLTGLKHHPAVPTSADWVTISASIGSPEALEYVRVYHRRDNSNNTGTWQFEPMTPEGEPRGDGLSRHVAQLGAYRGNGQLVQFYIEAKTTQGAIMRLPRWGAEKPALYVVDDRQHQGDLRKMRVVISAYDLGAIASGETSKYDYDFPRLANHYFNATFISNEEDIYYNAGVRNSGSPWTRGTNLDRGKLKLQEDKPFRGKVKHRWDNDAANSGSRHHNRIARYMLYLLGHPVNENEFVHVIINSNAPQLREDTEPVGNEFLDRNFVNGADGELYRIDDEWWFRDTWDRQSQDASWRFKNTTNPGAYRTEWMKRTRESEDDFTALIELFQTASRGYTQDEMEALTDPHAIMKMFVVRGYIDDWDSISLRRGKNGYFYRRAEDGKFQFLHWDSDLTFGSSSASFYQGLPGVNTYINRDYNMRLFHYYLTELLEQYTNGSPRMRAWMQQEEEASNQYTINQNTYLNWFRSRERNAQNLMRRYSGLALEITSQSNISQNGKQGTIELSGNASPGIFRLDVAGHPEATFQRQGASGWVLKGIQLKQGDNNLTLHGVDQWGHIRETVETSITQPSSSEPKLIVEANPASWNVSLEETLHLNAAASYDPEGDALRFTWQTSGQGATVQTQASSTESTVQFALPGWYDIAITTEDGAGNRVTQTRQASVHGRHGFSNFGASVLDPWWSLKGGRLADNRPEGMTLSTEQVPGQLSMRIASNQAHRWQDRLGAFPLLSRHLPNSGDWSLQTKLKLDTYRGDASWAGTMVSIRENGAETWYGIGLEGAGQVVIRRMTGSGTVTTLATVAVEADPIELRIRKQASALLFESGMDGMWAKLHQASLSADATGLDGGLFLTTSEAIDTRVLFDYALLVDPSLTSDLVLTLRPTEIMYHPMEPSEVEFIELTNTGNTTLDLAGGRFIEGIDYTFGPTQLPPGERLVVTGDREAFLSLYGSQGIRLASGSFSGKLDNAGERLSFADAEGNLVFTVDYSDGGNWPSRADGLGSSLEAVDPTADPGQANNWAASKTIQGSPGFSDTARPARILINEVLSHTDPPFEDAIELFNPGTTSVDIGGWYLSDAMSNLKKYQIPLGTQIPAGGFYVAYERAFLIQNKLEPFALSSAFGDEVYLTQADASGALIAFTDSVSFPASENGRSMGRYPDGEERWTTLDHQTLGTNLRNTDPKELLNAFASGKGAANAKPYVGSVVLSRIMYHPPLDGDEFIEITNRSDRTIALYDPWYPENTWKLEGGVQFTFPAGLALSPQSMALIVQSEPESFRSKYQLPPNLMILGPFQGRLENNGETIRLLRPDEPLQPPDPDAGFTAYLYEDEVRYDNELPWPREADGLGSGLKRIQLSGDGSQAANWMAFTDILPSLEDMDLDGMPDSWETSYGLNPAQADDALADADGDGMTNLHEFLAQTDPLNPSSRLVIDHIEPGALNQEVILVVWIQPGITYVAERASSMQAPDWTEVDRFLSSTQDPAYRWSLPTGVSQEAYYRIRVIPQ